MSSAHRPTWNPAIAKDARIDSRQYSSRDIAAHTKLKFRKPGQNATGDVQRRDLRLELELAEREAARKKRKAAGLEPLEEDEPAVTQVRGTIEGAAATSAAAAGVGDDGQEDAERAKRRKLVEEALLADRDDDDSDEEGTPKANGHDKGKGKAVNGDADDDADDDDSDESSDDDEEDETAELLRELEKIKRERAEEKERQERERAAADIVDREEEIATGNPLMNLRAALGQQPGNASPSPSMMSSSTATGFAVKRRWDDDVIFKNQARDVSETPKQEFVNDLLRTQYHKRFLKKFIA